MDNTITIQTRTNIIRASLSRLKNIPFFSAYLNFNEQSNNINQTNTIFIDEDYDTLQTIINISDNPLYPIEKDRLEYIASKCDYYGIKHNIQIKTKYIKSLITFGISTNKNDLSCKRITNTDIKHQVYFSRNEAEEYGFGKIKKSTVVLCAKIYGARINFPKHNRLMLPRIKFTIDTPTINNNSMTLYSVIKDYDHIIEYQSYNMSNSQQYIICNSYKIVYVFDCAKYNNYVEYKKGPSLSYQIINQWSNTVYEYNFDDGQIFYDVSRKYPLDQQ